MNHILKSIKFNRDIDFDVARASQEKMFKVKSTVRKLTPGQRKFLEKRGLEDKTEVVDKHFTLFKKGFELEFKPIMVIVGDNGCGKTTLINYLKPPDKHDLKLAEFANIMHDNDAVNNLWREWISNEDRTLDFNAQPNRVIVETGIHKKAFIGTFSELSKDSTGYMPPDKWIYLDNLENFSNGEITQDLLENFEEEKGSVIVLDEPETSLSIKTQIKIRRQLEKLAEHNQLIVITHSEVLMRMVDEVYDFERKKFVDTNSYIEEQKK